MPDALRQRLCRRNGQGVGAARSQSGFTGAKRTRDRSCSDTVFLGQRMSKHTNFVAQRRTEAQTLSTIVEKLVALSKPFAEVQGIDLQVRLVEGAARRAEELRQLAERLQESVLPFFIEDERGRPVRKGSCVLVRLDSDYYAFTAAHVIRGAASSRLWAPPGGKSGKLLPFPWSTSFSTSGGSRDPFDGGVFVLPASTLGSFARCIFLTGSEIDEGDEPDDRKLASCYFVLGYPESRRRVKISHGTHFIHQESFHCTTTPVDAAEYRQENRSQSDHILLDFDHKDIRVAGMRVTPPRLQGVSGGGLFHISRNTCQGPLVAIATDNPRNSRLIIGTRLKHFLAMARDLKATASPELFQ
jgi:hypothetical protein